MEPFLTSTPHLQSEIKKTEDDQRRWRERQDSLQLDAAFSMPLSLCGDLESLGVSIDADDANGGESIKGHP